MQGDRDLSGSPFQPDNGLPDTHRLRVVRHYLATHDAEVTASEFGVHPATVRRWARVYQQHDFEITKPAGSTKRTRP